MFKLTLYVSKFMKVDSDYQTIDTSRDFTFKHWDDVQNVIGYLVEGADGAVKFEITEIEEDQ